MILFGCDDGSVGIFNIKTKTIEEEMRDHDQAFSIRAVSFNTTDTLFASGSSNGELIVRKLIQEPSFQTELVFRDKSERSPLTAVRFSATKRHVIATSYESGVICIWDFTKLLRDDGNISGANPLRHRFFAHQDSCQGVAFSPVNNLLLCSAGLD